MNLFRAIKDSRTLPDHLELNEGDFVAVTIKGRPEPVEGKLESITDSVIVLSAYHGSGSKKQLEAELKEASELNDGMLPDFTIFDTHIIQSISKYKRYQPQKKSDQS